MPKGAVPGGDCLGPETRRAKRNGNTNFSSACGCSSLAVDSAPQLQLHGYGLRNEFSYWKSAPRVVGNPQTLATGEAPGGDRAGSLAWNLDSEFRAFVPGPGFSSTLPWFLGLSFERKALVPETNAPSQGWLVIRRLKGTAGARAGKAGLSLTGATCAEKCRTRFSDVSLGAQQVSPGTETSPLPRVD
jgi:hypothetical protein